MGDSEPAETAKDRRKSGKEEEALDTALYNGTEEEEEETEGSEHTDKVKFFSAHYDSVLLNI